MMLVVALLSCVLGNFFGWLIAALVPHAQAVVALALLAAVIWLLRLRVMPGRGSFWGWPLPRRPPPVAWVAITAAAISVVVTITAFPLANAWPAAVIGTILSVALYVLMIPRTLAWLHGHPDSPPPRDKTDAPTVDGGDSKSAAQPGRSTDGRIELFPVMWGAPAHHPERLKRILPWLDGTENPVSHSGDDIFDFSSAVREINGCLRPASPAGPAGTVFLDGQRGSGKSTLLRLAAEESRKTQAGVSLRFCYVSLWGHADLHAAMNEALASAMASIRDRVDILPLYGVVNSLPRALFGQGGGAGLLDAIGPPPTEIWLPAISEALLRAGLRLIFCIEDMDRVSPPDRINQGTALLEGFLDMVKRYPGFGYVVCGATPVWSEPAPQQGDAGTTVDAQVLAMQPRATDASPTASEVADAEREAQKIFSYDATVRAKLIGYLPVARLFQFRFDMQAFQYEQIEPVLEAFRVWMIQQVDPNFADPTTAMARVAGFGGHDRSEAFDAFLRDPSPLGVVRHLTPRVLRNGLRDARWRWEVIAVDATSKAKKEGGQAAQLCIDPDSVLVACLWLACFPERAGRVNLAGPESWCDNPSVARAREDNDRAISPKQTLADFFFPRAMEVRRVVAGLSKPTLDVLQYSTDKRPGGIYGREDAAKKNWEIFIGA